LFPANEYPCKIFCFLKFHDNDEIVAIVQSCQENNHENDSILYQRWKETGHAVGGRTQPWLHMVPASPFGEHVLVIEDDPSMKESEVRKEINLVAHLYFLGRNGGQKQFMLTV